MIEKILLVDDEPNVLAAYKRAYHKSFDLETAQGGEAALNLLNEGNSYSVIVSDLKMPGINGIEFLTKARAVAPHSIRMLLTGQADLPDIISVVNEGNIFRFLTKPCPRDTFETALKAGLEQYRLMQGERELLEHTLQGSISLLVEILSIVHPEVFSRAKRLRTMAHNIAARMHYESMWEVDIAALLAQVGCVTLPTKIVEKVNLRKKLSEKEHNIYLENLTIGSKLVAKIPRLRPISKAIEFQEKCFDGEGPPDDIDISGKQIPFLARILKIVNDYDTHLSSGLTSQETLKIMKQSSSRYDPEAMAALEGEILKINDGFVVKEISIYQLTTGMVLADDIRTVHGVVLVPKQYEISEVLLLRLMNTVTSSSIEEPIKVLHWLDEQQPEDQSDSIL